jgi:hypothetical protein
MTGALWDVKGNSQGFNSNDEIDEAIASVWPHLSFDPVQSVFHNWMSHLAWVIKNDEIYSYINKK